MDTPRWARLLNSAFPTLSREGFQIVDQPSDQYNCIAYACGWDAAELARLRALLHAEPHVRGLGYGQYADGGD